MKYIIIQGDGMGDIHSEPSQLTPLEAAKTPNMNRIAGCGELGLIHTIPEGLPPGSDVGNLSLFGYNPKEVYTGRSPLEAASMGVKLGPDDVAFRLNMVTLRGEGEGELMDDYSGGHIETEDSAPLLKALADALGDETFDFYPGVSYRHLLVWRGGAMNMETTPPHDILDKPIASHMPRGAGAEELVRIMEASRKILADHPQNQKREHPIDIAWLWGQGKAPSVPTFAQKFGLKGAAISAVDLVRGVAVYAGFKLINVPGATGFLDTDYTAKGAYALEALKDHDLVFVHIEAPDEAGHMGNREEKIKAIEAIDEKILGPMLEKLPELGDFKILVTSDHATPYSLRTHNSDPVPFAMADSKDLGDEPVVIKYGETDAARGEITIPDGHRIIELLISDL